MFRQEDLQNRNAELEVEVSVIEEDEEANRSVINVQMERAMKVEQDLHAENERLSRLLVRMSHYQGFVKVYVVSERSCELLCDKIDAGGAEDC